MVAILICFVGKVRIFLHTSSEHYSAHTEFDFTTNNRPSNKSFY